MAGFPNNLSNTDRLVLAKARADKLVNHIATLFLMHEANAIVIYSDQLVGQIPPSYAAHAFNQFQRSMHLFEIVRLAALWDPSRDDRESIPTIIALFDTPELIELLVQETYADYAKEAAPHAGRGNSGAELMKAEKTWWGRFRAERAAEQAHHVREWLETARTKAAEIQSSEQLKALRKFRDTYIAHNLDLPEPDITCEASVYRLKYGDERSLLKDTVTVADALHHALNQTSFDWKGSQQIAHDNAKALWNNCTFTVPHRSAGRGP